MHSKATKRRDSPSSGRELSHAERSGGAAASAVAPERAAPGSWPVRPHQDQGGAGEAGPELGPGATSAEMLSQSIFGEDHSAR